ncbi:hypothetical protein ACS0TY_024713 [Phlomoides rotata]
MESEHFQEYKSLVNEVTKGLEQVKQLKASSSTNQETVLERMLSSYEEALSILNGSASEEQCESVVSDTPACSVSSVLEATQSQTSGQPRKRESFSTITEQVSGTVLDDGYTWRKYGQKHILGARHPRSYYRCTHRVDRGCSATKYVQRSDDNPSVYAITYRGKHTCSRIKPVAPQVAVDAQISLSFTYPDILRPVPKIKHV